MPTGGALRNDLHQEGTRTFSPSNLTFHYTLDEESWALLSKIAAPKD
jgi:hypothetical protein